MICINCGREIPPWTRSVKYCSSKCSTLYLKSGWRKRNKDAVNAYNREYRKKSRAV